MDVREFEKMIINSYEEYLNGELLIDSVESCEQFISTLWYDLLDDIELNKETFGINQDLTDYDSAKMIENRIREVLMNR